MTTNRNEYMRLYREKNREKLRAYNREYNKKWRKENGYHNEYNSQKKYPEKEKARKLTRAAIKPGELIRLPCEVCGNPNSQAHHEDYNFPLRIKWLCPIHHTAHHRKLSLVSSKVLV